MPQKSYYHFWYESYSEKKSEITFWEFIELMILRIPEDDQLTQRLQDAAWKMLSPDISKSQFDTYWRNAMERPMILRIPEDDQLNTRNLFGRVHNICCDFHQQLTQT